MEHSRAFLELVMNAKASVRECTVAEADARLAADPSALLIDVREDHEWEAGHVKGARHLGRGIIERDIEKQIPDKDKPLLLYCGGGFRSILVAESLAKMGYRNACSIEGGFKAFKAAGREMEL